MKDFAQFHTKHENDEVVEGWLDVEGNFHKESYESIKKWYTTHTQPPKAQPKAVKKDDKA